MHPCNDTDPVKFCDNPLLSSLEMIWAVWWKCEKQESHDRLGRGSRYIRHDWTDSEFLQVCRDHHGLALRSEN